MRNMPSMCVVPATDVEAAGPTRLLAATVELTTARGGTSPRPSSKSITHENPRPSESLVLLTRTSSIATSSSRTPSISLAVASGWISLVTSPANSNAKVPVGVESAAQTTLCRSATRASAPNANVMTGGTMSSIATEISCTSASTGADTKPAVDTLAISI